MTSPRYIEHIVEPQKLLLSWQPLKSSGKPRMRRFVAELSKDTDDGIQLKYLIGTEDFKAACDAGFTDYPGFSIEKNVHKNVLPAFMRRLPPRKRNDFGRFLTSIRINPDDKEKISDFALLGYSGAKLPGDGFSIVNKFSNVLPPFEFMLDIQGCRFHLENVLYTQMNTTMQVRFQPEPENTKDPQAIMVMVDDKHIGHVCRGLNHSFHAWQNKGFQISAIIERINGTEENPKIYALVKVSDEK